MGEPQWGSSDNSLDSQSPRYKKDRDIWNSQVQHTLKISSAQRARLLTMRKEKIIKSAFPVVTSLICSHFKAPEVSRPRSKSCQRRKRDRPILSVPNIQFQHFVMYLFRLVDVRRSRIPYVRPRSDRTSGDLSQGGSGSDNFSEPERIVCIHRMNGYLFR